MSDQPSLRATGFLRLSAVLELIPVSRSAWWEGCRSGRYPRPIKLGPRITAWAVEDIHNLIARLRDES
jgi:prophage regulatory protein